MLKPMNELSFAERESPCQEYPGEWLVMLPDGGGMTSVASHWTRFWFSEERTHLGHSHQSFEEALEIAKSFLRYLEAHKVEYNPGSISIAWKCSDYDPRNGKPGFKPLRLHGWFDPFGNYVKKQY